LILLDLVINLIENKSIFKFISFTPIIDYIEKQYEDYLDAERAPKVRGNIPDNRVHCLLYFLKPTGMNRIADLDLEFLQRICTKVNVIPVIAKADSLAPEEVALFKKAV
jgi:septin 7